MQKNQKKIDEKGYDILSRKRTNISHSRLHFHGPRVNIIDRLLKHNGTRNLIKQQQRTHQGTFSLCRKDSYTLTAQHTQNGTPHKTWDEMTSRRPPKNHKKDTTGQMKDNKNIQKLLSIFVARFARYGTTSCVFTRKYAIFHHNVHFHFNKRKQ